MKRTPLVLIALAIASALLIAGCGGNSQNNDTKAATSDSASASDSAAVTNTLKIGDEEISYADLYSLVTKNAIAADQYIGKPIEATATVNSVAKDSFSVDYGNGIFVATCKNGRINAYGGDYCSIDIEVGDDTSVAASLKQGDQIKVSGTLSGFHTITGFQSDGASRQILDIALLCSESPIPYGDITVEKL